MDDETGFLGYVQETEFNQGTFDELLSTFQHPINFKQNRIEPQNWNAQWEASYEPIVVADKILVRAPFHDIKMDYAHTITIQPKNTFGTGHHETTQLVLELMLEQDFTNKQIFDYGCGTGVLGLMALKLGAAQIIGNDIDEWCLDNITENKNLNKLNNFEFRLGTLSVIKDTETFDGVLANINKNILLSSFTTIVKHMKPGAFLLISGFYESDLIDLKNATEPLGLLFKKHLVKNNWCAAQYAYQPK
jgi:ribosomal protein L11 methyltransferase